MVELLQEGIVILISIILGASLLLLVQPNLTLINKTIMENGSKTLLKDFERLLKRYNYIIELKIESRFHVFYDGRLLSLKIYGYRFSKPANLGAYPFELSGNCTIRFDGTGWKIVG